eukprot:jgi/Mesvir1/22715/Mv14126-RA.1
MASTTPSNRITKPEIAKRARSNLQTSPAKAGTMLSARQWQAYLSHSSRDAEMARSLKKILNSSYFRVKVCETEDKHAAGTQSPDSGVAASQVFLLLLTEVALRDPTVQSQVMEALHQNKAFVVVQEQAQAERLGTTGLLEAIQSNGGSSQAEGAVAHAILQRASHNSSACATTTTTAAMTCAAGGPSPTSSLPASCSSPSACSTSSFSGSATTTLGGDSPNLTGEQGPSATMGGQTHDWEVTRADGGAPFAFLTVAIPLSPLRAGHSNPSADVLVNAVRQFCAVTTSHGSLSSNSDGSLCASTSLSPSSSPCSSKGGRSVRSRVLASAIPDAAALHGSSTRGVASDQGADARDATSGAGAVVAPSPPAASATALRSDSGCPPDDKGAVIEAWLHQAYPDTHDGFCDKALAGEDALQEVLDLDGGFIDVDVQPRATPPKASAVSQGTATCDAPRRLSTGPAAAKGQTPSQENSVRGDHHLSGTSGAAPMTRGAAQGTPQETAGTAAAALQHFDMIHTDDLHGGGHAPATNPQLAYLDILDTPMMLEDDDDILLAPALSLPLAGGHMFTRSSSRSGSEAYNFLDYDDLPAGPGLAGNGAHSGAQYDLGLPLSWEGVPPPPASSMSLSTEADEDYWDDELADDAEGEEEGRGHSNGGLDGRRWGCMDEGFNNVFGVQGGCGALGSALGVWGGQARYPGGEMQRKARSRRGGRQLQASHAMVGRSDAMPCSSGSSYSFAGAEPTGMDRPSDGDKEMEDENEAVDCAGAGARNRHTIGLTLNIASVLDSWQGPMWSTLTGGGIAGADVDTRAATVPDASCYPAIVADLEAYLGLTPCAREDPEARGARILRYREKRRTRCFNTGVHSEMRRANALKRPRVKGRFVKVEAC